MYNRACTTKKVCIKELLNDHAENIKKVGHNFFIRKTLDEKLIKDRKNLPEPTRESTRVRIFDTNTLKWLKTTSKMVSDPFGVNSSFKDKKDEE